MANKHLRTELHDIDDDCWWYEEGVGICVVRQIRDDGERYIRTDQHIIPWRSIRDALERKDK